jgi:hypothetical protein
MIIDLSNDTFLLGVNLNLLWKNYDDPYNEGDAFLQQGIRALCKEVWPYLH